MFEVDSPIVQSCLAVQRTWWESRNEEDSLADPHGNLKDVLPLSERRKLMTYVHTKRNDWLSTSISLVWGQNAAVCGASQRKWVLSDLRLSGGFGPGETESHARCLMLILRKGKVHKDRFSKKKQVSAWRHKDYLLCTVFNTAATVIWRLHTLGNSVNFSKPRRGRPMWWDLELLDWTTYNGKSCLVCHSDIDAYWRFSFLPLFLFSTEQSSAYQQIYKGAGVKSCKVMHERTNAIQYAGSQGLTPPEIATFTKHLLEKLHQSYAPESNSRVSTTCNLYWIVYV